jgi:predicted TPR repeat methyltransferase
MSSSSTTASARLPVDDDPIEYARALQAEGRAAEAAQFLRTRIEAGRGGLLMRLALVAALSESGDREAALCVAREAQALNPNISDAVVALGESLQGVGHLPAAIAEFQRALRLDPDSVPARFKLGCAWAEAGEAEKALEQFAQLTPGTVHDLAERIASVEAMCCIPRSDPGYVRYLFDQFSADYDMRMRGQLAYRAPEILRELADFVIPGASDLVALDLGCGTGLAAEVFAGMTREIDGIDLSPAMIERARARRFYRHLEVGDIETSLANGTPHYDLVLAADTLVYLGDLTAAFQGVARCLKPGGLFLFTTETSPDAEFELGPKRRWRHAERYIRHRASLAGFEVAGLLTCSPRNEAGVPVEGFAVALRKQ